MTREAQIERRLSNRIAHMGGWCLKLSPYTKAGVPDRLVLLEGAVYFVELKAPAGRPTALQSRIHGQLRSLGFDVRVLSSAREVDEFIDEIK